MVETIGYGLMIGGGLIAAVAITPMMIGFVSAGVVAGSVAAGAQAAIGNVAAGSFFAAITSLGMTGALTTTAVGGAVSAATGATIIILNPSP